MPSSISRRAQSGEQRVVVPAGRDQDAFDGEQWPLRVGGLAGELKRRTVAGGLHVRQRGDVPQAVGVGEQVDVAPDDLLVGAAPCGMTCTPAMSVGRQRWLVGYPLPETPRTSCDLLILVEQSAEPVAPDGARLAY